MSISQGYIFGATELVTNTKLGLLVNDATLNVTEAELDVANAPSDNYLMGWDGSKLSWMAQQSLVSISSSGYSAIQFVIDGGGDIISTGVKGDIEVPFDCVITNADLLTNETGTFMIDVWKDTYANFPPTDADTITGGSLLSVIDGNKAQQSLASWALSIASGDILRYNVGCCASITRATASIWVTK